MNQDLKLVMLVDDDTDDNFFHERVVKKVDGQLDVVVHQSAQEALDYLKHEVNRGKIPNLIFLDINMPGMDGWEFLEEYNKLEASLQSKIVIIMLTTSSDERDRIRAKRWNFVSDFITKPLTKQVFEKIVAEHFS